jgi:dTDP-4-amino-4,6-dideoxygalactose transaminase
MIPHFDLRRQTQALKPHLMKVFEQTLDDCSFVLGPQVEAFEKSFAAYCSNAYATGVNSGPSALHLALLAGGVRPGDEVITVPFTFAATVTSILYAGAVPKLIDVDADTFTMSARLIESAISEKTRAVLPVHLYGQPADMDAINAVAQKHGLAVVEDAAQAHGAVYKGRRVGSLGDLASFSFYPGKNIGACGEGGIIVTGNRDFDVRVKRLRNWGEAERYQHVEVGFNYRMDGLQGAILSVKLQHLEEWTNRRIAIAKRYAEEIKHPGLKLPRVASYADRHVYHQYVVLAEERDSFMTHMRSKGVGTSIHYPHAVYAMPAYSHLGYQKGACPVSEKSAAHCVSLPLFPELSDDEVSAVIQAANSWQ